MTKKEMRERHERTMARIQSGEVMQPRPISEADRKRLAELLAERDRDEPLS